MINLNMGRDKSGDEWSHHRYMTMRTVNAIGKKHSKKSIISVNER